MPKKLVYVHVSSAECRAKSQHKPPAAGVGVVAAKYKSILLRWSLRFFSMIMNQKRMKGHF
jgi:hypothetical protein